MNSPFYQPARQNFSSSQSMQQPQGGFDGFGGGQAFSGFGGGQGFNFGGGQAFGGFQQPQFNPFQSGFGGGFGGSFSPFQSGFGGFQQPQFNPFQGSFGGGFNLMFGGIGGLGFNPMMGMQFGMPMQGFAPYQERASSRDPYRQQFQPQQDVALRQDQMPRVADPTSPLSEQQWSANIEEQKAKGAMGNWGTYQDYVRNFKTPEQTQDVIRQRQQQSGLTPLRPQQEGFENPYRDQENELQNQLRALPEYQALQNAQRSFEDSDAFKSIQQKQRELAQQMQATQAQRQQPMYGGIGGLGFNPMMGSQFGMPMGNFGYYR